MKKTLKKITKLVRLGDSEACPVVAHHSQMGRAGVKKATGFDRVLYGRNSRALQFWTRGQINVAPLDPKDNTRLLIGCGKNSNGLDFPPFAVRLNDLGIYEVDTAFDFDQWQLDLKHGDSSGRYQLSPSAVAKHVKDVPLTRSALKESLMEETGCSQARPRPL